MYIEKFAKICVVLRLLHKFVVLLLFLQKQQQQQPPPKSNNTPKIYLYKHIYSHGMEYFKIK